VLVDSGSSHSLMPSGFARAHGFLLQGSRLPHVTLAEGGLSSIDGVVSVTVINSGRTSMKFQLSVCLIAYCPFRGTPSSSVCLKKNNSQKIMLDAVVFVLRR